MQLRRNVSSNLAVSIFVADAERRYKSFVTMLGFGICSFISSCRLKFLRHIN